MSLPEHATLQSAWLDNEKISPAAAPDSAKPLHIALPSGKGFATVSFYFSTTDTLPFLASRLQPPFPKLDIPVMARQWTIWLPPGYAVAEADGAYTTDSLTPMTWSQRLFGAFGRGAGQKLFNPFAASDWRAVWGPSEQQQSSRVADGLIQNFGTIAAEYTGGEGLSWGQMLSLCAQVDTQPRRLLLLEPDGLRQLGITAHSRVRMQAGETVWQRGAATLQHSGLALLTNDVALVLTSAANAAAYSGQLLPSDGSLVKTLLPGPLADEVREASGRGAWSRFETIDSWRSSPADQPTPWRRPALAGDFFEGSQGWTACTLRLTQPDNPGVRVVQTSAMSSFAWAIFLGIVGLCLSGAGVRPANLLGLAAAGACVALVVAAAYAPLASSVFLAATVCLTITLTRLIQTRVAPSDHSHGSRRMRSSVIHELARVILVAALVHLSLAVHAAQPAESPVAPTRKPSNQESETPRPGATAPASLPAGDSPATIAAQKPAEAKTPALVAPLYRVFVPTDERQNPVGDKLYVPQEFYRRLYRLAAGASDEPRDWLITRGHYQGTLAHDAISNRLSVAQFKATYDIEVFQSNVTVRIPLAREAPTRKILTRGLKDARFRWSGVRPATPS